MTAYDLLLLAVAAPASDHELPLVPDPMRVWDRHCLDAIRVFFGAEPLFAGATPDPPRCTCATEVLV